MKRTILLALVAAFAAAQQTATVEGVVVNKVTGAGIGGATVRLEASNANPYEVLTDESGAFQLKGVKAGEYSSSVERKGYFPVYSDFVFGDRPKHAINPSGNAVRLRLELNPPAVLRGRVVDRDGKPVRASVDLGKGRTVNTDVEGSFAFVNLPPGPYTLLARPKVAEQPPATAGARTELVPTYYPAVLEHTQAESIFARAGAELTGYEIRLQSVPVYRVRGTVLDPAGNPAPKAVVELRNITNGGNPDRFVFIGLGARQSFSIRNGPDGVDAVGDEPTVTGDDGRFEFSAVRAGEWEVQAQGAPARDETRHRDIMSFGSATVSIGRGDPDELKIQLARPFNLSGTVAKADGSALEAEVFVVVSLILGVGHSGAGSNSNGGSTLQFDNVMPGTHEIRADVMTGNYYTSAVLLGSREITGQSVELSSASPPIKVILTPAATLRGSTEDAEAGTVVVFPQSFAGVGYSAQSGAGGTFELTGLPPGDYYAIALDRFDPRTMSGVLFLRGLMPRATSVRVEPGPVSASSVRLKVNRAPE